MQRGLYGEPLSKITSLLAYFGGDSSRGRTKYERLVFQQPVMICPHEGPCEGIETIT